MDELIYQEIKFELWNQWVKPDSPPQIAPFNFSIEEYNRIKESEPENLTPFEQSIQDKINSYRRGHEIMQDRYDNYEDRMEKLKHELELRNELNDLLRRELEQIETKMDKDDFIDLLDRTSDMDADQLRQLIENGFSAVKVDHEVGEVISQLKDSLKPGDDAMSPEEQTLREAAARNTGGMVRGGEPT